MAKIGDTPAGIDKAEARRQQVLEAASVCFRKNGFHGTSIARISDAAKMSPGHIYHYFANKDAIVEAIAKREEHDISQLARKLEVDKIGGTIAERLMRLVDDSVDRFVDPQYVQLHLELAAEGARNPQINRILRQSDSVVVRQFLAAAEKVGLPDGVDRAEMKARMMIVSAVFNGLMLRATTGQMPDRKVLVRILKGVIQSIVEGNDGHR
ncbi:TetR family transcriptional regulator [Stenotrophomonas rhizophila]|uniref:TetR family transcriptional regulator n=1 Tax=Stenotrophomonas rhizophila TaxID=216778 RepID=A0A498CUB4_9GAMM|nr:TetR/AcrR family transcriptional regulator [Stenotrophomonas rhizophila]RLK57605.1 TetR family transcriptional regulator [Stenotrophomonas rhizophila]